jgi:hypothetical protein
VDQVRKISALVQEERATIRGTGRMTGRFGGGSWYGGHLEGFGGSFSAVTENQAEHATALSQILAPPSEPLYARRWGVVSRVLLVLGVPPGLLALLTVPNVHCAYDPPTAPTRSVCWDGQGSMLLELRTGVMPDPAVLTRMVDGGLIALPIVLLSGLAVLRTIVGMRRRRRFHNAYQAWQRAYDQWSRLFFCRRCDGVFEPGGIPCLVPPDEMLAHLSQREV